MSQKIKQQNLKEEIVDLKDFQGRQFEVFAENFHIMKAALRYFSVDIGMSFTSTKISKKFPVTASVAGTCLNMMEDLNIVESRNSSASPKRFRPQKTNLEKLLEVEQVLVESLEIRDFCGSKSEAA